MEPTYNAEYLTLPLRGFALLDRLAITDNIRRFDAVFLDFIDPDLYLETVS